MSGYDTLGISPLSTIGLGGYGSYADPTMGMGLTGMTGMSGLTGMGTMGMMGSMGMGSMGMMGMYNPSFMGQMNKVYQDLEKQQLEHTGAMHQLMLQNNTKAYTDQDRALFEKAMVDAGVNRGIQNLESKIKEGDSDGVCQAYDDLKQTLYAKFGDYFKSNAATVDPSDYVNNYIVLLYSQIISKQRGEQADLETDIKKYGETAFEHGFWKNFHGKDYHSKNAEETLSYVFDRPIDNKAGKERMDKYGAYAEKGVEGIAALAAGYGGGLAVAGLAKAINPFNICKSLGLKGSNRFAKLASLGVLGLDILWQMSR